MTKRTCRVCAADIRVGDSAMPVQIVGLCAAGGASTRLRASWRRLAGVTEFEEMPGGRSLIIDHGWAEVAEAPLDFIGRFT
jgi:hypothetical protein